MRTVDYFKYASVDFLIDNNGMPVFMEVNDNTLAPYYIEQKSQIAKQLQLEYEDLINFNLGHEKALLSCFDGCYSEKYGNNTENKSIAIVCKRRNHPESIDKEITYLRNLFVQNGYDATTLIPEDCMINNGKIVIKKSGKEPSIIFRRNFSYPNKPIQQPVINDLLVREISNNKYLTHQIIKEVEKKKKTMFKQPDTYLVKDEYSLIEIMKMLKNKNCEYIAKPNSSYGGDGFCYIQNKRFSEKEDYQKLEFIMKALEKGKEYIIQNKIDSLLFHSIDNKDYCFDIRVMIYNGIFAGIEGRRSSICYKKETDESLITNIKFGGKDLLVLGTNNKQGYLNNRYIIPDRLIHQLNFDLDSRILILDNELFQTLKDVSIEIVKAIDTAVQIRRTDNAKENWNCNYDVR